MSRHRPGRAYGHHISYCKDFGGYYMISWCWDRYYVGSRLRFPQQMRRETDRKGAERFAKKHGLKMPEEKS